MQSVLLRKYVIQAASLASGFHVNARCQLAADSCRLASLAEDRNQSLCRTNRTSFIRNPAATSIAESVSGVKCVK